ncbi:MAG: enoyl-CoA hydratase/isomerase family protein [Rhodoferax sp.]|nr:enoyl-CoA hydratase/isomerase family protein [Rhodoferax sp.]MCB2008438.1 enoyl-CoA hydratase/isomerase family protein [Rhodoferax sp.]MCB2029627.1 enoyl-CoA hydratase/isomerase family protein [Rhodoferax sp.]MCB2039486.1 enoyl-CoA hydratase/isomerase family protein [Rhodoferax sp.]MCP5263602.1 enoyl-CoA hydratase/isomerase family protein [Rhodoferax sp.]
MELLALRQDGPVARIMIDHPARRNAFSRAMWRELPGLVRSALADPRTRLLTLQGAQAGLFAAGADIREFEQTYSVPGEAVVAAREVQDAVDALAHCPLPVVALIDGPCVGGGVSLATACDVRIASVQARFAVTPARLGLSYHPDQLRLLVQVCGLAAASELLLGGQLWTAERALQAGLVNQVWPLHAFAEQAGLLVQAIAANSLDATRALKHGLRAVVAQDPEGLAQAEQAFLALFEGPDFIEGRDAFLQRRPARFPSHAADVAP